MCNDNHMGHHWHADTCKFKPPKGTPAPNITQPVKLQDGVKTILAFQFIPFLSNFHFVSVSKALFILFSDTVCYV